MMMMIARVLGCNKQVEAFQRVHDVNVIEDLIVGGSRRARENVVVVLLNLVKSSRENTMGGIREVDRAEVAMRALVVGDKRVSVRGKS
ncbi:hypothetical protein C4D60_Mb01t18430 [Musa balbisiana]|uniref:Uncharacterized protein n=1 Tax=Musa balbisiana TaxID=52838 RepID=A0A4S8JP32_MUSBA|nr:hypothetical protein C4D60_Mb01t18430 [Musa balbisiana]